MLALLIGVVLVGTSSIMNWVVVREFRATPRTLVVQRLQNYADMHDCNSAKSDVADELGHTVTSDQDMLTGKQHKILLGILKKVESKNSTLARLFTFLGALGIALAFDPDLGVYRQLALLSITYIGMFLFSAVRGMHQIDQRSSWGQNSKEMQDELIRDMLEKEAELRYCLFGANLGVLLMGISVPIVLVFGPI